MIGERLEACVGAVMFCIAISLLLYLADGVDQMAKSVCDYEHDADSQIERSIREQEISGMRVTYEQMVSELLNDHLEYDLIIDGKTIKKDEYNLTGITEYLPQAKTEYSVIPQYDVKGQVTCVEYKSK